MKLKTFFTTIVLIANIISYGSCFASEAASHPKLPYKELIFVPGQLASSHAPGIVELPNGELFAVWYAAAQWTRDAVIWGARKPLGAQKWTAPFLVHYTPGCSNKNPVLYMDADKKLWLFWSDERRWHKWMVDTLRVRTSKDFGRTWDDARDVGVPKGFLPKTPPLKLSDGRIVLPLYTDWNASSFAVTSKDNGLTWGQPRPIIFLFGTQPTIIERSDSTLFALTRAGTWPRKAWQAVSKDIGISWKEQRTSNVNNPGSSLEMLKLKNGHVVLAFNNSRIDRSSISVALSYDEGRTWPYIKQIEFREKHNFQYPSVMQDSLGLIHIVYSYDNRASIAHFVTDEKWIAS